MKKPMRAATLAILWVSCILVSCQAPKPDTQQDRFHFILGSSQQHPQKSEDHLKQLLSEHQQNNDTLGIARVSWALGALLKSPTYQQNLQQEQRITSYTESASYFEIARIHYIDLGKNALAASASVGAVNAYLLANQLAEACAAYAKAKQLQQLFNSQQDEKTVANMNKNIAAFKDVLADC